MSLKFGLNRSGLCIVFIGLLLLYSPVLLYSAEKYELPAEPRLRSRAAALYDYETGTLLFSKAGETPFPPASMTKLMTLHLVYKAIEEGRFGPDTVVQIGIDEDFRNMPRRSSLMFLEEGQEVTVLQLMEGLAVSSGNDAAVALARLVGGDVNRFVEQMNREAANLGLKDVHFVDPAGLSEENMVTAVEFGRFCIHYIRSHPEALEQLHNLESFTYPTEEDVRNGEPVSLGTITQNNYNVLIGRHPWVDGLKTGYIDESGYNIALTAVVGDRRLVAVLLGGPGDNPDEGALTRAIDGIHLLTFGFYAFSRVVPELPEMGPVKVWKGSVRQIDVDMPVPEPLILPAGQAPLITSGYEIGGPLEAPLSIHDRIGTAKLRIGEKTLVEYPLYPSEDVEPGSWLRRVWDSVRLFFRRLFS